MSITIEKDGLFAVYPELEDYWCWKENNELGIYPNKISPNSHIKVYLRCRKCNEPHLRQVRQYINAKGICLYCNHRRIKSGVNDVFTLYPDLKEFYAFDKNNIDYTKLGPNSREKVYWYCMECHRPFEQSVGSRVKSSGLCPICGHWGVIEGDNDLFSLRPDLEIYWDYEKNTKDPKALTLNSNYVCSWLCSECGRPYNRLIPVVTSGSTKCPICTNYSVEMGVNDLATTHPYLLQIWNYEKNDKLGIYPTKLTYGSEKKVWWKCNKGHEYIQTPNRKTSKYFGCPICAKKKQTSFPEQYFYLCLKGLYGDVRSRYKYNGIEIDIYLPKYNIGIEYNGIYYHNKKEDKDEEKINRIKSFGVKLFVVKEVEEKIDGCKKKNDIYIYNLSSYYKKDSEKWNIIISDLVNEINKITNQNVKFIPPDFNEMAIMIVTEIQNQDYEDSFGVKFPELMKEWDYNKNKSIDPYSISYAAHIPIWWICQLGHSYNSLLSNRTHKTRNTDCPYCENKKIWVGFNDLASQNSEMAEFFDVEKNGITPDKVLYGGEKEWWFKCDLGHEFKGTIHKRKKAIYSCPICYSQNRWKKKYRRNKDLDY